MTSMQSSETLQRIYDAAAIYARDRGTLLSSADLLLAVLTVESEARPLLIDGGLTVDHITAGLSTPEPQDTLDRIRRELGRVFGSGAETTPLQLLATLCSYVRESAAHQILTTVGIDVRGIAMTAIRLSQSQDPRRRRRRAPEGLPAATVEGEAHEALAAAVPAPAPAASMTQAPASLAEPAPSLESSAALDEPAAPARRNRARDRARDRALHDPRVTRGTGDPPAAADETPPPDPAARFVLDEEAYPTLTSMGRNLSEAAARGQLEPLIGRRTFVDQILDILGKRRANNPCLVGEPGVGKTAIVEGLAYLQVHDPAAVPFLEDKRLVEINMGTLVSGTQLRGTFNERMASLRTEVEAAEGKIIVFLDEIHTLVGAGAVGEGALDAVGELSAAMARGLFPCIGATTTDNYKKYIEEAPALQRRLQMVLVPEPSVQETLEILGGLVPSYERHHKVAFLPESLEAAVRLSGRYIANRFLPDKALGLLDLAGSRAHRKSRTQVGRAEVAELVAETAGIPAPRLLMTDTERFLHMDGFLEAHIIGHRAIIKRVCQVIRRNYAGFSSNRPIGSFLFLGPTGVGKTETVKVLGDFLFQSREALCRFDMSEFQEPHSVARLIGSPPGYVGHDEGGQLTESVRRKPYQIVLLDEVEKAHRDVLQILLQLLDDGRLTDGRGRTVDFSNTVVVMTSNLGSDHYDRRRGPIGFGVADGGGGGGEADPDWQRIAEEVLSTARKAFPIELWNRIEERMVFEPLRREQILEVAKLLVRSSSDRLAVEKRIRFSATDAALAYLVDHGGFDPLLGARPMRTTIQRLVEGPVAEQILLRRVGEGEELLVDCVDGKLVVEKRVSSPPAAV
jgi:ATP-dependent Clp protease ATP-binding subunit ClpC